MNRGASISIADATVRYARAERAAVTNVSLDVAPGELIVLIGPSGCGKSTLLRTINRLISLESGAIAVDGTDVAALDPVPLRRTIGYAIQAVGLFAHMTVAENIAIVPQLLRWSRPRCEARVEQLLALVRLDPARYRDRYPRELSGGEAQRVGVARAIAAEPRVLLMDEPFGAVDAIVRGELQTEMLRIVRELGTTTLLVTHDVDEALHLADRIVVMRDGAVEQIATPIGLLTQPATPFVRQLVRSNDAVLALRTRAMSQTHA